MPDPEAKLASHTRRVAIVGSLTSSLVNFRLDLLRALVANGHEVLALAPDECPITQAKLTEIGVGFRQIPMARTGMNPIKDAQTLASLRRAFNEFKPDVVLPYTMKPIIYGGLAARMTRVPSTYALMTGLGYVFVGDGRNLRSRLLRTVSAVLYRASLRRAKRVFVYNQADADVLRDIGAVTNDQLRIIPGTGVDTARYTPSPPPEGPPRFLLIGRLLRLKGIHEYVQAARTLKKKYPDATFQLLGPVDPSPDAISLQDVAAWQAEGIVEYLGETNDVRPHLTACSVFVLPSHREGASRSVQEAMSTGRAVVSTNAPGCAEPIDEGVTGFVANVNDAMSLAAAMENFCQNPALIESMGKAARQRAVEIYDVHAVNRVLLHEMELDQASTESASHSTATQLSYAS